MNRAAFAADLIERPYRKLPGSRRFFLGVRDRTKRGDVIAVYAPLATGPEWSGAYDYLYGRALYPLAGRLAVPTIDAQSRVAMANVMRADYVACYRSEPPFPGFTPVWRTGDGVLLRRTR